MNRLGLSELILITDNCLNVEVGAASCNLTATHFVHMLKSNQVSLIVDYVHTQFHFLHIKTLVK